MYLLLLLLLPLTKIYSIPTTQGFALKGADSAHVIALDPNKALPLAQAVRYFLSIPNTTVFRAVNSTQALLEVGSLSLYSQYLLKHQLRHDHMQLSTVPMLGCLMSHMRLWSSLQPNQTIAVFEEDAYLDETSRLRFGVILGKDLRDVPWDILMLESGSIIASGRYRFLCSAYALSHKHSHSFCTLSLRCRQAQP